MYQIDQSGKIEQTNIDFATIGRRVMAHTRGYLIFTGKLKTKTILKFEELFEQIKKTEVGKRLKNA